MNSLINYGANPALDRYLGADNVPSPRPTKQDLKEVEETLKRHMTPEEFTMYLNSPEYVVNRLFCIDTSRVEKLALFDALSKKL